MNEPARRRATYEDVLAAPEHRVAEIVDGELYLHPRPAMPHAIAASALGEELGPPFKRGRGGPGGWIIVDEPELHLGGDVLVPDLAGWRRERLPEVPDAPFLELAPDWLCEVLSPSTQRLDRGPKLRIYGRAGVSHVWFVEPRDRTLEILERQGDRWTILDHFEGDAKIRARPFEAIELELAALWEGVARGPTGER
ncbi:MAG: Uma2 family endonuclease [Nannocystaceae bacterium]